MIKKVALITGSARGIGRGIARAMAMAGFNIVLNDIVEEDKTLDTMTEIRSFDIDAIYCKADVSQEKDREQMILKIKDHFGRLDILVNNAGVAPDKRIDILEINEQSYDRVININLRGPFFLTQRIAGWMAQQKKQDDSRRPIIINIASISSYTSSPARAQYCISKAGVSMMTKLFADRLSEFGILVYEIRPGIIATDMTAPVKEKYDKMIDEGLLPIKRWGTPEDIAKACAMLASEVLSYSTGQVINIDGGFHIRRL